MGSCWLLPANTRPLFSTIIETLRHQLQRLGSGHGSTPLFSAPGKKLKSLFTMPLPSIGSLASDDSRLHNGVYAASAPASPVLRGDGSPFQRGKNLSQRSVRSIAACSNDRLPTSLLSFQGSSSFGDSWEVVEIDERNGTSSLRVKEATAASKAQQPSRKPLLRTVTTRSCDDLISSTHCHSCLPDSDFDEVQATLKQSAGLAQSLPQLSANNIVRTPSIHSQKQLRETSL